MEFINSLFDKELIDTVLTFLGIAGVLALILMAIGMSTSCPSCKEWFAERDMGEEIINQKIGYQTHDREIVTKDGDGNVISRRYEPEQRKIKTTWYYQHYECNSCGHRWKIKNERTTDNFYED